MDGNGACKQCPREMETIHVLRDCRVSRDIWNLLRSDLQDTFFFSLPLRERLKENAYESKDGYWKTLFVVTCWRIWTRRCRVVFNEDVDEEKDVGLLRNIRLTTMIVVSALSGAGGLIRAADGKWLMGFQACLGFCSNNVAKMQALRLGLLLAWGLGFRDVQCSVDSKVVVDLIADADQRFNPHGNLIEDVRASIRI
ncbi:uncharacterized protein LOC111489926 [Cucurbita maxima]|uniref:Uncharacterized protein LOC111489926 n=1 Tax=Cucurbita maxima TaxID=3661 RepID=A0A6J1K471_CUCMA|nr:uncharacterized protein LOC111489926 [Cucurbita maxima]